MVNGVVVISTTFVTVLVIFIYLCKFMDSRSRCNCALRRDSSSMTCAMIFCSSYLVISSINIRYCDARSWYDVGREEQNINVVMSLDNFE